MGGTCSRRVTHSDPDQTLADLESGSSRASISSVSDNANSDLAEALFNDRGQPPLSL